MADATGRAPLSLEALIERLGGAVYRTSRGVMVRCPAHQDRRPSLSISEGDDGRVLIHDFGGCETRAVLAAAGLHFSALFLHQGRRRPPDSPRSPVGEWVTRQRRAQARLAPYLPAFVLADRLREDERAVTTLRQVASAQGDVEAAWELLAAAAVLTDEVRLGDLELETGLRQAAQTRYRRSPYA